METDRLKEILEYLRTEPEITYNPYPNYDPRIFEILYSLGEEIDYIDKHEKIIDKDIREMSIEEIKTMYTFISRGERFCDGHIAGYIEDGTLLKLVKRQLELRDM